MTKIKNFFLNGQLYYVEESVTISDLINYFNFNDSLLVLEYNNLICDKKKWKETDKNSDKPTAVEWSNFWTLWKGPKENNRQKIQEKIGPIGAPYFGP